jgi:hypothetical protein
MGLRCTVVGHDYGNVQQVEERQERGDELVVTVREYRECQRCGDRKTLTENTEVRSGDIDDVGDATGSDDTAETDQTANPTESGDGTGATPDTGVDQSPAPDPTTEEASAGESTGFGTVDPFADTGESGESEEGVSATDDDGIILDDNSPADADGGRGHGEWPGEGDADQTREDNSDQTRPVEDDADQTRSGGDESDQPRKDDAGQPRTVEDDAGMDDTGHGDWPTPDAEDQGYDAAPSAADPEDDVDFVGDLDRDESGVSTDESIPEETGPGEGAANSPSNTTAGTARSGSDPAARQPPGGGSTVLACQSCGTTTASQATPLRSGDICPECGQGYLAEREE